MVTKDHNLVTRSAVATAANFAHQSRELCAPKPIRPGYENPLETFGNSSHIRTSKATRTATTRFSSARCVVALAWGLLRFAALRCTQHQESKKPDTWPGSIWWWSGSALDAGHDLALCEGCAAHVMLIPRPVSIAGMRPRFTDTA